MSSCFLLVFLHPSQLMVILLPKYFRKLFLLYSPIYYSRHSGPYHFSCGLFQRLLTSVPGLSFTPLNAIFQPGARLIFLNGLPDLINIFKHLSKAPYYLQEKKIGDSLKLQ